MYKSTLIIWIGVACLVISALAEYGTRGKSTFPLFRRARELSTVFCCSLSAMHYESFLATILVIALIVWIVAMSEGNDLFREGFRRLVRYVFRRNAPSNPQK